MIASGASYDGPSYDGDWAARTGWCLSRTLTFVDALVEQQCRQSPTRPPLESLQARRAEHAGGPGRIRDVGRLKAHPTVSPTPPEPTRPGGVHGLRGPQTSETRVSLCRLVDRSKIA
jgi:hypothetical protein